MFSPFPQTPDVNLTGEEAFLNLANTEKTGIGDVYAKKVCGFQEINEIYGLLMTVEGSSELDQA